MESFSKSRRVLPGEINTSWQRWGEYKDIFLDKSDDGIARVAINRPEKRNAFRPQTVSELCEAFRIVRNDPKNWGGLIYRRGPL